MKQVLSIKRNPFLDYTKAFAILLVVVGHCIQYGSGQNYLKEELFFDNILFKFIYSFHMPLFMLISGYLFAYGINKETKSIIINKFESLIIPVFTWAIGPLIVFMMLRLLKGDFSLISSVKYYISYSVTSLWFLWSVFLCSLIVVTINRLFRDKIIVYLILFIVSFFIPDTYNLALYKFMFPYFVLGYFYKKYDLQEKFKTIYRSSYFLLSIGVIFIILLYYFKRKSYIYISGHTILGKDILSQLHIDFYRYTIGLIGSVFMLLLLRKFTPPASLGAKNLILTIGKNTMGIYILSSFINLYVLSKITNIVTSPNFIIIVVESILIIFFSLLGVRFIQKYTILNKYLLGAKI